MPRWFVVALTLVLYATAMGLVWWGLKTWAGPWLGTFYDGAGGLVAWLALAGILTIAAVAAFWPRISAGWTRSRLSSRD